jgi:hypothetical protein
MINMHDYFYHGVWRMDWGLGNPNKTAALIAMLMLSLWSLANFRKWGFWLRLSLFTVLGIGLIHTFSRGGIIALFVGAIPIIYFSNRPWPWLNIGGATVAIWIMVGAAITLDAQDRYGQGVVQQDRSIDNRLDIWREAPEMMVDAPWGWGLGNSGHAYMEWYQPLDQSEQYRTLVNSHLTWLVELGWPLRFIYVLMWASVLLLCWPNEMARELSIPFGVWIAFAISAVFSSVAESPWLWIIPIICLIATIIFRAQRSNWPAAKYWTIPLAVSGAMILGVCIMGSNEGQISGSNDSVVLGRGDPDIWIIVNSKVMGQNYGHSIRQYLRQQGSLRSAVGVANSPDISKDKNRTVVFAGNIPCDDKTKLALSSAKRVILLNPFFSPEDAGLIKANDGRIKVIFGEFSQSPALYAWENFATVERINGIGDFMPQWPKLVLLTQ